MFQSLTLIRNFTSPFVSWKGYLNEYSTISSGYLGSFIVPYFQIENSCLKNTCQVICHYDNVFKGWLHLLKKDQLVKMNAGMVIKMYHSNVSFSSFLHSCKFYITKYKPLDPVVTKAFKEISSNRKMIFVS